MTRREPTLKEQLSDQEKQELALEVESYILLCFAVLDEECGSPSATKKYLTSLGMHVRTYHRLRSLSCGISLEQPCLDKLGTATGFLLKKSATSTPRFVQNF